MFQVIALLKLGRMLNYFDRGIIAIVSVNQFTKSNVKCTISLFYLIITECFKIITLGYVLATDRASFKIVPTWRKVVLVNKQFACSSYWAAPKSDPNIWRFKQHHIFRQIRFICQLTFQFVLRFNTLLDRN